MTHDESQEDEPSDDGGTDSESAGTDAERTADATGKEDPDEGLDLVTQGGKPTKVIGRLSDTDGIGVLGEATGSGNTAGVLGMTDSSDGYGLSTPDDAKIEGTIDTAETDFVVEAGTTNTVDATNVVMGHAQNSVADGVVGATIGGGGIYDGNTDQSHTVSNDVATISGGSENTASGYASTIAGGRINEARALGTAILGGRQNRADESFDVVCGGDRNKTSVQTASDPEDYTVGKNFVGGGLRNEAEGGYAVVTGGRNNKARAKAATVPGGRENEAFGEYSLAAGRKAQAHHNGSFVWADSTDSYVPSSGADQFIVEANGGVGINQNDPTHQLHVTGNSGSQDNFSGNTALIEDTDDYRSRALAIKTGNSSSNLSDLDQYITFYDADNNALGAITGNSNDGVNFTSFGSDYAEYMPRVDPEEEIETADIVGVVGDGVTKRTDESEQVLVVSDRAVVTGNSPGTDPEDKADYETVAFVGQVPVKVRGAVEADDLIVPSGENDGVGRAVSADEWCPADGPVVGRARERSDGDGVAEVSVMVGVDDPTLLGEQMAAQRERIDDLAGEVDELRAENDDLRDQLTAMQDRLAALEAGQGSPAPADD